jgi:hypothetical protein
MHRRLRFLCRWNGVNDRSNLRLFSKGGNEMQEKMSIQGAYTAVVEHFVKNGRAPHYTELAGTLGLPPEEARQVQRKAAESAIACWFVKDTDYVESWAPFSNVPTHYRVTIKGEQKWYGQ